MHVVERCQQLNVLGQQHAVPEHVARHIADANAGKILRLDIDAHFTEVPLDGFPGTACGDAHLLVVIPLAAARCESISQPVSVFNGNGVGKIGKCRRSLVGGNHQIRVVVIKNYDAFGVRDLRAGNVVRNVEQTGQENLVARNAFGQERIATAFRGRLFADKPAL